MAEYWVSTTGDDDGTGAFGDPWLTPQFALDTAVAGDVVYYMDGTYDIGTGLDVDTNSGASGNVISHLAQNPGNVVWDLTGNGVAVHFDTVDYVTISGIEVRGRVAFASFALVYIEDSEHITIDDCELNDCFQFVVYLSGSPNCLLQDCVIHSESTGDGDGIATYAGANDGLTIAGCTVYHVGHVGINLKSSDDVAITDCEVYDCASHCVAFSPDSGKSVDNCIIDDCILHGAGNYGALGAPHKGIRCREGASDITIQHNVIYACDGSGIMIWQSATGPIYIYNNTIYGNDTDVGDAPEVYLYDDGPGGTPTVVFENNILFKTIGAGHTLRADPSLHTNLTSDYNLFYDTTTTSTVRRNGTDYDFTDYVPAQEANSVLGNPTLTDPPGDMTLIVGSPAIDAGVDVGLSYLGTAPDIGAHEFDPGSASQSPSASVSPSSSISPSTSLSESPSISPSTSPSQSPSAFIEC